MNNIAWQLDDQACLAGQIETVPLSGEQSQVSYNCFIYRGNRTADSAAAYVTGS